MRILCLMLVLGVPACHRGVPPFVAPSTSDVLHISAEIYNRPDGGEGIPEFDISKESHEAVLGFLNGSMHEPEPMKWQVLGDIKITFSGGTHEIELFRTVEEHVAFRTNDRYYRSGAAQEFIRLALTGKSLQRQ